MLYPALGLAAAAAIATVLLARRKSLRSPTGLIRVTYWAGRGKCEPLRCILAAAGVRFEERDFDAETGKAALAELRASGDLAYDQVPLVEIDGLRLVQGTATAWYLGTRLGLLPSDPVQSYAAQHVYASSQDARQPLVSYPFRDYPSPPTEQTKADTLAECRGPKGLVGRYAPKWEAMLRASGGPFFLGHRPSIGVTCPHILWSISSPRGRTPRRVPMVPTTRSPPYTLLFYIHMYAALAAQDIGVFEACDCFRDVFGAAEFDKAFASYPSLLQGHTWCTATPWDLPLGALLIRRM